MKHTIRVGPFGCHFTNRNTAMGLKAHSHFAQVFVEYGYGPDKPGWPSFADTNRALGDTIRAAVAKPITGTNEDVLAIIDAAVAGHAGPDGYPGCRYWLRAVELHVQGVIDDIGHDPSVTVYRIEDETR